MTLEPAKVRRVQRFFGSEIDGKFGDQSLDAILAFIDAHPELAAAPAPVAGIPQAAIDLILQSEGLDQPSRWPGGYSGITIGRGFDLGYSTEFQLRTAWRPHLTEDQLRLLSLACGRRGPNAKSLARNFTDIVITAKAADDVFYRITVPQWISAAVAAFPGFEQLPDLVRGALVSLVFNRGTDMADNPADPNFDRRREMRQIRGYVALFSNPSTDRTLRPAILKEIAASLRSMTRLWKNSDVTGLVTRRNSEAALVESAIV